MKNAFGTLQKVGKALMLPVALLPAAGILLAIGAALVNPALLNLAPWLDNSGVAMVANVMQNAGNVVFGNLPLLFAVGVAVGLAGGEGTAGLAAIIGYLIINVTLVTFLVFDAKDFNEKSYESARGTPTPQT